MSRSGLPTELNLPWVKGREDRLFVLLNGIAIALLVLLVVWLNQLQTPELEKKELAEVAPRLARLILEKAPVPKKETKLEKIAPAVEKPKPVEKAETKPPETKPEKKPEIPDSRTKAREKAARSGLLAMSDELADLRENLDLTHLDGVQSSQGKTELLSSATESLKRRSAKGSGGIKDGSFERGQSQQQLAQAPTSEVKSNILALADANRSSNTKRRQKAAIQERTREEVEKVFQHNKGPIFSIYNRALRSDPLLRGRVVVELTIAPDGKVTHCVLVSSELHNEKLEKRLISRIKRFKFQARKVQVTTVTYPIDFLPS